jgi:hypothetical protein
MDTDLSQVPTAPSAVIISLPGGGASSSAVAFNDLLQSTTPGSGAANPGGSLPASVPGALLGSPAITAIATTAVSPTPTNANPDPNSAQNPTPSITVLTSTNTSGQKTGGLLVVSNTPVSPTVNADPSLGSITVVQTSTETAQTIANLIQTAPLTTSTDGGPAATVVIDHVAVGETPSVDIENPSTVNGNVTIHIRVADLQAAQDNELATRVIDSGADYRRQLYQSLGSAFQLLSAGAAPSGVDYVTSVVLAQQGLRPDESGSVNPLDTYDGGAQVARATTYIGQVIPPQLDDLLTSLGASGDFLKGYNTVRQSIVDALQDRFGPVSAVPGDATDEAAAQQLRTLDYPFNPNDLSASDFYNVQEALTAFGFASFSQNTLYRESNDDKKKNVSKERHRNKNDEEDQDDA